MMIKYYLFGKKFKTPLNYKEEKNMSKYFLAGVANAEIFDGENNLFATAKALTDSSISIGVNAEEVRGGEGAAEGRVRTLRPVSADCHRCP